MEYLDKVLGVKVTYEDEQKKSSCMSRKCGRKKKIDKAVDDGMSGAVWV